MNSRSFFAAISLFLMLTAGEALAEPIGSAVRVVNKVTGSLDQQPQRDIAVGDGVNQNEAIEVADNALGELKLRDDSKIALGPGARLVLDKFVYDPTASTGTVSVNLVKGAFRFITGLSRKQNYQLRTPSAAITVRGTVFDVYIDPNGGTWLLLLEGSVQVCNTAGQCADVSNPCGVVHISATGVLDGPQGWPSQTREINFDTAFPFVGTPPSIDATPLFTRTAVELNQCQAKKPDLQEAEAPPTPGPSKTSPPPQQTYTPPPPAYDNSQPSRPYIVLTRHFAGAYAGVVAGAVWQQTDPYLGCSDYTNPDPNVCSTYLSFSIPGNAFDLNDSGFLGGGQAGYNFSFGNIVLGVEADIAYTDIDTTSSFDQVIPFGCCTIVRGSAMRQELSSLSTIRGRLGYAFDNILLYATGGLALGQVDYKFELNWSDINGTASDESSKLAAGYTLGAGAEISFGQWSLKTEYLFYDLGQETLNAPFLINGAREPFTFRPEFDTQGHIVRIGTNFRFDLPGE